MKYHRNMEMPNNGANLRKQVQRRAAMVFPQGATGEYLSHSYLFLWDTAHSVLCHSSCAQERI